MHIEYIALFCETTYVLAGFRLTNYVHVLGTTTSTYWVIDEMSGLWSDFWKSGNGIIYRANFSTSFCQDLRHLLLFTCYCYQFEFVISFETLFLKFLCFVLLFLEAVSIQYLILDNRLCYSKLYFCNYTFGVIRFLKKNCIGVSNVSEFKA